MQEILRIYFDGNCLIGEKKEIDEICGAYKKLKRKKSIFYMIKARFGFAIVENF